MWKKDFPRYEAVEYQNFLKHRFFAPDPRNRSLWVRKKDFPRYEAASYQYFVLCGNQFTALNI
ncbi:MAG: hypothetical protein IIV82_03430 [Ruminococcus sp.]|nr:hypothetical protein [Ruminococcus sp.]